MEYEIVPLFQYLTEGERSEGGVVGDRIRKCLTVP